MSCDHHRTAYFRQLAASAGAVADTFGTPQEAEASLEQIFNTARARAPLGNPSQVKQAEAATQALFDQMAAAGHDMRHLHHTALPSRKDAWFGYSAVYKTLEAIRNRKPLPALANAILSHRQHTRKISSSGRDAKGYHRCASCGRFTSPVCSHLCPITASSESLNRTLMGRLGVPSTAYGNSLEALLNDARKGGSAIAMRHALTGEVVEVTLDGLPLALATGFTPEAWKGQTTAVELADGRVVSVLNATGLTPIQPCSGATSAAGMAYGISMPEGAPVGSAASLPPVSYHRVREDATTGVQGGQAYDLRHFIGSEYRKGGSHGAQVAVYGIPYTVGMRSMDPADWSSSRLSGRESAPKGGVAVGRTLVAAMGILSTGEVVETANGIVEVYGSCRRDLLAVYDPSTNIAGDTQGNPNASAAQMAAVIAQRALHPQNAFDIALATDLARMHAGTGTPLAATDSAYLTIKNSLLTDGRTITMGGTVATHRCPQCGQFAGDGHICPGITQTPQQNNQQFDTQPQPGQINAPVDTRPIAEALRYSPASSTVVDVSVDTTPIAEALRSAPQPQVAVQAAVDTSDIADALRHAPPAQVTAAFDAQAFAQALRSELGSLTPVTQTALDTQKVAELRQAVTQMAQAVETLAKAQGKAPVVSTDLSPTEQRLLDATDRLTTSLTPARMPVESAAPRSGRCPRCGLPLDSGHTCPPPPPRQVRELPGDRQLTPQEKIFHPVTLPAPDPYLPKVPAHIGGQLYQPLVEHIPELDPQFELNAQAEKILRTMSAALQVGAGKPKSNWSRSFGLYGPPGTGKNTLARQLAASIQTVDTDGQVTQGLSYTEANIAPESSMAELIGTTVLETDPTSGSTISRARLGKIGLAAAMGSVICINEIVRSPKLATALQSMIEDGEIQIDSPEQGLIRIPVHPSTIFVCTWNPGYEGDAERPAAAPLSRMIPLRLDYPSLEEQAQRVDAFLGTINGDAIEPDEREQRRKEIIAKDYSVPTRIEASKDEILAATRFFNEVQRLAGGGVGEKMIGLNSATSTAPGPRELGRFVALGKTVGWEEALETLKITCDQDDQFESQWQLVRERFEAHFGSDAEALKRQQAGQAPAVS